MSALPQPGDDLPDHAVQALEDAVADACFAPAAESQLADLLRLYDRGGPRYHRTLFRLVAQLAVAALQEPVPASTARLQ